jgi:hypothetical protein
MTMMMKSWLIRIFGGNRRNPFLVFRSRIRSLVLSTEKAVTKSMR